ncbi:MAG: DNA replication/repair protein RecF [Thermoleophilaceae bacterium]
MRVTDVQLRDFRNYGRAAVSVGEGLTVIAGLNGAGKTNLLEAVYFGCVGRSPRTNNERELVRAGAGVARVTVNTIEDNGTSHRLEAGLEPGTAKVLRVDGASVDSLSRTPARPLVSVFLPERLELVKGPPAARRAHLDSFVAALWPARREARMAYSRALSQRNALLARIRAGVSSPATLVTWDAELAEWGMRLMADRSEAVALLARRFSELATLLGLADEGTLEYRPRSRAPDAGALAAELAERHAADLERGFTAHGPHRDDIRLSHGGRSLRRYGSQGEQRVSLLALLFAERDVLRDQRGRTPLMLLDDVMSELDASRRLLLADLVREGGQSLLTTTEADHVPGARDCGVRLIEVEAGVATALAEGAGRT